METQKSLNEFQENTNTQVKKLNKTIQDLKIEVETRQKSQRDTTLEIRKIGKRSGVRDASITNRTQQLNERISHEDDNIENIVTTVKENKKMQEAPNQKYPGNPEYKEKTKPKDNIYRREHCI